jgi:hypothetical protein
MTTLQIRAQAELERRRRQNTQAPILSTFKTRYRHNWVGFVHDCIAWKDGEGPSFYQDEIMEQLPVVRRACVRGPHGLGKTALASWGVLWFALTRDGEDWKIPTTASAWRQLTKFLWPEVHKWSRKLRWERIGRPAFDERLELQKLNLKLSTGEAFAVASDVPEYIEGAHADCLFYLFDESKAIPNETFDAAEGAFSTAGDDLPGEAYALAISTPGDPFGRFYDIQSKKAGFEDWWARAVTLEETIQARRVSRQWAEQRKAQWGEESSLYQRRVLGNFASEEEDTVIPLSWIEAAQERWQEWNEAGKPGVLEALGVDVGAGGDPSALAKLFDVQESSVKKAIDNLIYETSADPLKIGDMAARAMRDAPGTRCVVDAIGVGSGTVSHLRRQGFTNVLGFVAGATAPLKDRRGREKKDRSGEFGFADLRSWAWWTMREMLDPQYQEGWALPPDDRLTGDLSAPKWKEAGREQIKVESKDDVKKRLHRSTDAADAVIETLYDEPAPQTASEPESQGWIY